MMSFLITDITHSLLVTSVQLHMVLECHRSTKVFFGADGTFHHRVGVVRELVNPEELLTGGGVATVLLVTVQHGALPVRVFVLSVKVEANLRQELLLTEQTGKYGRLWLGMTGDDVLLQTGLGGKVTAAVKTLIEIFQFLDYYFVLAWVCDAP